MRTLAALLLAMLSALAAEAQAPPAILVEAGSATRWIGNAANPGLGLSWTVDTFDDSSWTAGVFGVGYETGTGAAALLNTRVPAGVFSVYTRTTFTVADASMVTRLDFGADYDDGVIAWLNGVEIWRSAEMPGGAVAWNTDAGLHESSNAAAPVYTPYTDVTAVGLPALRTGTNVLAVGVWNGNAPTSSDLVLVPRLIANRVPTEVERGPWLQSASPTSLVVRWRTGTLQDSRVRYGDAPGNLTSQVSGAAVTTEHEVTLTGLTPATRYHYSVGNTTQVLAGDDGQHWFVTPPPAGTRQSFRVWALGDAGTKDANQARVRDAYRAYSATTPTDVWLLLGDNAYDNGTDADYQAAVFDMYPETLRTAAVWPTYGNHDGRSADSSTQSGVYYDLFTLPTVGECGGLPSGTEAYYSFDFANVHFVCLDSYETSRSATGAMATWLAADLAAATSDWIVAFFHHPPYTRGSHDSDTAVECVDMRERFIPILEDAGVDLVLSGHSHSYERTFLIDDHTGLAATFGPANVVDGGDGRVTGDGAYVKPTFGLAPHEGTVYVVGGNSGKTSGGPLDHRAMFRALDVLGSVVLDVAGNRLDVTFLSDTGAQRDTFTLIKGTVGLVETDCTNGLDDDLDGRTDCADSNCLGLDSDGDGATDCAGDCALTDPGVFAAPGAVDRLDVLRVGATDAELRFADARPLAGTATVHDVMTGRLDELWVDRDLRRAGCLVPDSGVPSAIDSRLVGVAGGSGVGWWYLVRAQNSCGDGPLGVDSQGVPRSVPPGTCD